MAIDTGKKYSALTVQVLRPALMWLNLAQGNERALISNTQSKSQKTKYQLTEFLNGSDKLLYQLPSQFWPSGFIIKQVMPVFSTLSEDAKRM